MSEVQAVQLVLAGELLEVRAYFFAGERDGEGAGMVARLVVAGVILVCWWSLALAREGDDHGNHGALKPWFDSLRSNKGLCCSFADGVKIEDPDYGTEAVAEGGETVIRYWVRLHGQKISVPPDALITEPNKFGPAVVWPYAESNGDGTQTIKIRCFMPGAGA